MAAAATDYVIYEVKGTTKTAKVIATGTSYTMTDVTAGSHSYQVRPRKVYTGGEKAYGSYSATKTLTVEDAAWKVAPKITSIKQTGTGKITIAWSVTAAADDYVIYEVNGSTKTAIKIVTGTSYTKTGVSKGTHQYEVRPRKVSSSGTKTYGNYSATASITVIDAWMVAPTLTVAQTGEGKVQLSWTVSGAATDYVVYEVNGSTKTAIKIVTGTSYTKTGVSKGTHKYEVRPRKVSSDGTKTYGNYSATKTITVIDAWKIAPTLTVEQTGEGKVKLSWTVAGAATDYVVYEVSGSTKTEIKTVTSTSYTRTNVTPGTHKYEVRPRKTDSSGTQTYGDYSATKSLFVKIIESAKVGNFTYGIVKDNYVQVVKYHGTAATVTVPEKVVEDYYTVSRIGPEAFMGNTTLVTIDLPDTISVIGARAFKNCTKLSNMK